MASGDENVTDDAEACSDKPSAQITEHPPALTEPYRKARRNYVLFSALLIAWELIGFDVNEVPLENVKITIKSPQAIPFVLIVIIGYFAVRLVQEWFQCDSRRRSDKWALSDFATAHMIGAASILIYWAQRLLEMQLADVIAGADIAVFSITFIAGITAAAELSEWKKRSVMANTFIVAVLVLGFGVALYRRITQSETSTSILALAAVLSFALGMSAIHGIRSLIVHFAVRGKAPD